MLLTSLYVLSILLMRTKDNTLGAVPIEGNANMPLSNTREDASMALKLMSDASIHYIHSIHIGNGCAVLTDRPPSCHSNQLNGKASQEVKSKVCPVHRQ